MVVVTTTTTKPNHASNQKCVLENVFDRSRLGCQICVREDMAGMKVRIPDDGFK